jgi:hypothetical protein
MTMDDKFLYQQRPPVRASFAENLYQRLSNRSVSKSQRVKRSSALMWKFALAAILGLSLLFALSGPARADVLELIRRIGGFDVEEVEMAPTFGPNPTVYSYTPQPMPDALQGLPFSFAMPAYIPDGYTLSNDVVVAQSKSWVSLRWANKSGQEIDLLVQQDWDLGLPAGPGAAEEIQIDREPAMLLRGGWGPNGEWDAKKNTLQLYWRHGNLIYTFEFWNLPPNSDQDVYVQELIRVAESIH